MHSHLVPGVDDGSPDLETSLQLIEALQKLGFQNLITTPHVMIDLYPNTRDGILKAIEPLQEALIKNGSSVKLEIAAEYLIDDHFKQLIKKEKLLSFADERLLVEMSFFAPTPGLHEALFEIQTKGYKPILAHPERYLYYRTDFEQFHRLKEYGCSFQINTLSLIGYYGKPAKEIAWKLIKQELVDYIGTDLHHAQHAEKLKSALSNEKVQALLKTYPFKNNALSY